MGETRPLGPEDYDPRFDVSMQYGMTSANVRSRFKLYEYAADGRPNTHQQIVDDIGNTAYPEASVLDAGCSDRYTLRRLRQEIGQTGRLVGTDVNDVFEVNPVEVDKDNMMGIEFRQESVLNIGEADASIDVALALFLLYHVPSYDKALMEFQRVLKPGGWLYVATSGPSNKRRHREFEEEVAATLNVEPPPRFAETFDVNIAAEVLPHYFSEVEHVPQVTDMVIKTENAINDYLLSIWSMGSACYPPLGGEWGRAAADIVPSKIRQEIEQYGAFVDSIDRHWFKCRNL